MKPSPHAWCAVLLLTAACGGKTPPPPPQPPSVSISTASASIVDTQLSYSLSVTGCDSVSTVQLFDKGNFLTTLGYSGNPTNGSLQVSQIPYQTDGIAADLALVAKATCNDGRFNSSQTAAVVFFPVAQVISNTDGSQIVPDLFYAEGQGATATFVGCSGQPNGTSALVRVDTTGKVVGYNTSLPFPCDDNASFTDKGPNGMRWMLQPGVGVLAVDSSLHTLAYSLGAYSHIAMGPDGDAVVHNAQGGASVVLGRLSHLNSSFVWAFNPQGVLTGNPIVRTGFGVTIPEYIDQLGMMHGTLATEAVDYATGTLSGQYSLAQIDYGFLGSPAIPPTSFSADGSIIYVPFQTPAGTSTVLACATTPSPPTAGCQSAPNLRWTSTSLPGVVRLALPFANYSRVAALAPQFAWFLDESTGTLLNSQPVSPTGALITTSVQAGLGTDVYLLNGTGSALPTEIVAIDDPAKGEVFRYDTPGGTLTAAVDDSGQPWLRIGPNLVQPLPLTQYRAVHP